MRTLFAASSTSEGSLSQVLVVSRVVTQAPLEFVKYQIPGANPSEE